MFTEHLRSNDVLRFPEHPRSDDGNEVEMGLKRQLLVFGVEQALQDGPAGDADV